MFNNIPLEMQQLPQWVVWKLETRPGATPNDKKTKVPYCPQSGKKANPVDPLTWSTFAHACHVASFGMHQGIGFVIKPEDPYTCIDLDDPYEIDTKTGLLKYDDPQKVVDNQTQIFNEFCSYSERSPSGKGLHIWVKANIGEGRRRQGVELYSGERYMTMTGDVFAASEIVERQELTQQLWDQMAPKHFQSVCIGEGDEQTLGDAEVLEACSTQMNGEKFKDLYNGDYQKYNMGDGSQSIADMALIGMIAFRSRNKEQTKRIFRTSALGRREKAQRDKYVDDIMDKSFARLMPSVNIEMLKEQLDALMKAKLEPVPPKVEPVEVKPIIKPVIEQPSKFETNIYEKPPGLIGDIADFMYEAAPRPVAEIALAGALGMMAGICGRAYNISAMGLNQYILLLATTGTGKEGIGSGTDKLFSSILATVPSAIEFIGPAEIASPQALLKYMSNEANSFSSVMGEFGLFLQQLSSWNADANKKGLRRIILDLYNKSGEGRVFRPSIYSDKDKNTKPVISPAFSILGESTPESFYGALSESMIDEGLLPRFTTIEYKGKRPPMNKKHHLAKPTRTLSEQLAALCAHALTLNAANKAVQIEATEQGQLMLDEFDVFCDAKINNTSSDIVRKLWTRGHMKLLKLAGLVAVGINPFNPCVDEHSVKWAARIIVSDIENILQRFESGEIGEDTAETKQVEDVKRIICDFMRKPFAEISKYKAATPLMHSDRVVTMSYINRRLAASAAFRKDKMGASRAIARTIETLKNQGDIKELATNQTHATYNFSGKCYVITNLQAFPI